MLAPRLSVRIAVAGPRHTRGGSAALLVASSPLNEWVYFTSTRLMVCDQAAATSEVPAK